MIAIQYLVCYNVKAFKILGVAHARQTITVFAVKTARRRHIRALRSFKARPDMCISCNRNTQYNGCEDIICS